MSCEGICTEQIDIDSTHEYAMRKSKARKRKKKELAKVVQALLGSS